jgi:hypothetical protein
MPEHRGQRRYDYRADLATSWTTRGSDPAATRPPGRPSAPPPAWPAPARRGKAPRRRRRRVRPVSLLLVRPLRRLLAAYVRALVRAVIPWLLPLGILAVISRLSIYLSHH